MIERKLWSSLTQGKMMATLLKNIFIKREIHSKYFSLSSLIAQQLRQRKPYPTVFVFSYNTIRPFSHNKLSVLHRFQFQYPFSRLSFSTFLKKNHHIRVPTTTVTSSLSLRKLTSLNAKSITPLILRIRISSNLLQKRFMNSTTHLGFWKKLQIKTKIILMGQVRPWRLDDFLALFSWIFVGNTIFVLVGTTTFVSIVLLVANSLQFQEYIVRKLGDYLSEETGFKITFESAQVPRWINGVIRLTDVSMVCNANSWIEMKQEERRHRGLPLLDPEDIDLNWTFWDIKVQHVDVTLSLWRWLEGRGFLTECRFKGVRGDVDRRHVVWHDDWEPVRRIAQAGDFELDKFVVDDLLLTIRNPNFRLFSISVFHGEAPLLRKQWLLYDLMCANHIVGLFDNCLFSVHKPHIDALSELGNTWSKINHLKVSGISIDHLNAGTTGPFSWITSGLLDLDLEFMIPKIGKESVVKLLEEEFQELQFLAKDKLGQVLSRTALPRFKDVENSVIQDGGTMLNQKQLTLDPMSKANINTSVIHEEVMPNVVMKWHVQLKDLKASVPIATNELSLFGNALIRPIIAYMNAHRTCIPLSFPTCMDLKNFDGAWTIYDSHLMDTLSTEVGSSLTRLVMNERIRSKQLKKVGWWSFASLTKNLAGVVVDHHQPTTLRTHEQISFIQ